MKKNIKRFFMIKFKSPCLKRMDFFVLLLFLNLFGYAQSSHLDSIRNAFKTNPEFLIKLDAKYSFVSSQLVTMRGVKIGLNYNNTIKLGFGYSWMKNNFIFDNPTDLINNELHDLKYSYFSVFGDYRFYSKKKLSFLINSDFAIIKLGYKNKVLNSFDYLSYGFVFEPSLISEYRFFKYFIIGSGLGYRFVFREKKQITQQFSAPLLILRLKVDFSMVYNKLTKRNKE